MNTPAHAIFNLLVLGRPPRERWVVPISIGAVLPDLPMVWFYFREKVLLGTAEAVIWGEAYYRRSWQAFFDFFNSLPLIALGAAAAYALKKQWAAVLFLSMGVHCLADLPLHNDDAHRHLFPFSEWRFESPVSYWDPRYGGLWVALAEILMVLGGSIFLARQLRSRGTRALLGLVLVSYLTYIAYVLVVWV